MQRLTCWNTWRLKTKKKPDFYRKTGLSNGFLDKNEHISSKNLEIIISIYTDLNLYWLITGEGSMYRTPGVMNEAPPPDRDEVVRLLREKVADQQKIIGLLEEKVEALMAGGNDGTEIASAAG